MTSYTINRRAQYYEKHRQQPENSKFIKYIVIHNIDLTGVNWNSKIYMMQRYIMDIDIWCVKLVI